MPFRVGNNIFEATEGKNGWATLAYISPQDAQARFGTVYANWKDLIPQVNPASIQTNTSAYPNGILSIDIPGQPIGKIIVPNKETGQLLGLSDQQLATVPSGGGVNVSQELAQATQDYARARAGGPRSSIFASIQPLRNASDIISEATSATPANQLSPEAYQYRASGRLGTIQSDISGPPAANSSTGSPALPPEYQALYGQLKNYLTELQKRGQVINPSIDITPEQVAQFTAQAQSEIAPYYATQLKLARESFLNYLGYSRDAIQQQEQQLEQQYGQNLRQLGEQSAEQGFAQSGIRQRAEGQLALNTQNIINANRRTLNYNLGNATREFAQRYGTNNLPSATLTGSPRVLPSEASFQFGSEQPFYQLSSDVYQGLTGEQQYEQRAAEKNRAAQLESAFRQQQATNQLRQLIL